MRWTKLSLMSLTALCLFIVCLQEYIHTKRKCLCNSKEMVVIIACAPTNGQSVRALAASKSRIVMEKPAAEQQQQQWAVLKCPRCESSNTKFCYYNNYSLSQPRHFCKACKRYWTRGGTLRNVPVGGGCRRKNKRPKRPSSSETAIDGASCSVSVTGNVGVSINPRPAAQPQIMDIHTNSPLFYGIPTNRSELNDLQFNSTSVSNIDTLSGFDNLDGLGAPFSSNFSFAKQIAFQDEVSTSSSFLPRYNPIFGSSSCSASSPTMASFLLNGNGTLKQPRQVTSHFQTIPPFQNQMQQVDPVGPLDPSLYYNSTSVNNAWHDPGNAGSSQSLL